VKRTCIVGVGESACGRLPDKTELQLHQEAARAALADAGLSARDVDGLFTCGADPLQPLLVAEYLRLEPCYVDGTQAGGASWECFVGHAAAAIAAGRCEVALLVHGATALSDVKRRERHARPPPHGPEQYEAPYGLTLTARHALAARRHMHEYGTTSRQLAAVATAANAWAQRNPAAFHYGRPLSIEQALASPMVADPLRRSDCCLRTDGGGAVMLTTAERARNLRRRPVRVLGAAEAHSHLHVTQWKDMTELPARGSAARAYEMAGVRPEDIDVAQVYDSFTITVLLSLEAFGFCPRGESGGFVEDGALAPGGRLPVNTDGGGLACQQPGTRGVFLLIEATRQLRGECGARQVAGARLALCSGVGGALSSCGTVILGRE
jgi:acetyl-CoA acetyltransferase